MDTKNKGKIVTSPLFSQISGLIHGFSTRSWGDMRVLGNRNDFISSLGLNQHDVYFKMQMHGDIVHVIDSKTDLSQLSDADGAISIFDKKRTRNIALTVRSADCVPILFIDPKTKTTAVVHAGWQGTLLGISGAVVKKMKNIGSRPADILVFIGSHIGTCCYSIDQLRAEKFSKRFLPKDSVVIFRDGKYFADLGRANVLELQKSGILQSNIDSDNVCTSCAVDERFSYRKDTPATYGVMMGVIAWK